MEIWGQKRGQEGGPGNTEAGIGVVLLLAREHLWLPEAVQDKEASSPGCQLLDFEFKPPKP